MVGSFKMRERRRRRWRRPWWSHESWWRGRVLLSALGGSCRCLGALLCCYWQPEGVKVVCEILLFFVVCQSLYESKGRCTSANEYKGGIFGGDFWGASCMPVAVPGKKPLLYFSTDLFQLSLSYAGNSQYWKGHVVYAHVLLASLLLSSASSSSSFSIVVAESRLAFGLYRLFASRL